MLPGRTEHVIDELRKSKMFCLSSDYEGMSNSMIDAICVGLPIISTRVSGTEELIHDGENGFLVNIGDVEELSHAFRKLIIDEVLREKISNKCYAIASLFAIDVIVNQWREIIEEVK